jgi:hypothetical protein
MKILNKTEYKSIFLEYTKLKEVNKMDTLTVPQMKKEDALKLLQEWLDDESGYDEKYWPVIKKTMEENNLSLRKKFYE